MELSGRQLAVFLFLFVALEVTLGGMGSSNSGWVVAKGTASQKIGEQTVTARKHFYLGWKEAYVFLTSQVDNDKQTIDTDQTMSFEALDSNFNYSKDKLQGGGNAAIAFSILSFFLLPAILYTVRKRLRWPTVALLTVLGFMQLVAWSAYLGNAHKVMDDFALSDVTLDGAGYGAIWVWLFSWGFAISFAVRPPLQEGYTAQPTPVYSDNTAETSTTYQ